MVQPPFLLLAGCSHWLDLPRSQRMRRPGTQSMEVSPGHREGEAGEGIPKGSTLACSLNFRKAQYGPGLQGFCH